MEAVTRWIWIVVVVGVVLLLVHPRSNAPHVIGALSDESIGNIKALQGNSPR